MFGSGFQMNLLYYLSNDITKEPCLLPFSKTGFPPAQTATMFQKLSGEALR